jgi:hypothetical protein
VNQNTSLISSESLPIELSLYLARALTIPKMTKGRLNIARIKYLLIDET